MLKHIPAQNFGRFLNRKIVIQIDPEMSRDEIIKLLNSTPLSLSNPLPESAPIPTGILFEPEKSKILKFENEELKTSNEKIISTFNGEKYFDELAAKNFGKKLLYFPHLPSTENLFTNKNVGEWAGLAVLADRQTAGRGRKENQ